MAERRKEFLIPNPPDQKCFKHPRKNIHIRRALLGLILVERTQQSGHWNLESGGQDWDNGPVKLESDVGGGWSRGGL